MGEDDAGGAAGKSGGASAAGAKSAGKKTGGSLARPKKKSRFDQNLFIKFSKPVHSESVIWLCPFLWSLLQSRDSTTLAIIPK